MKTNLTTERFAFSPEVAQAMHAGRPVVALESNVITGGLPKPVNLQLALQVEEEVRSQGATPATIAILGGKVHVGLTQSELENLASLEAPTRLVDRRSFGIVIARKENGGTTVGGSLIIARQVGIEVFATGGIGGVHREPPFDISADLQELSRAHMIVVCAGAKAILDLPATVEVLDTMGVPIIGYRTTEFPAFYSPNSGLAVTETVQNTEEIIQIAKSHWDTGVDSCLLVVVPPPADVALPLPQIEVEIARALEEAKKRNLRGPAVTPFLLNKVSELSGGASLKANLALLRNNARLAAQIAVTMAAA